jgi:hypothetical protein
MAKRKRTNAAAADRVNKSATIREYKKSHPSHKPAKISAALTADGLPVSAQFVSTVLSTAKKKKMMKQPRKPGRPQGRKSTTQSKSDTKRAVRPATSNDQNAYAALLQLKQIVTELGGIEQTRQALSALEQLAD